MKGDFSRKTFNEAKNYNGVLKQQGRVSLDADANELMEILAHQQRVRTVDIIGTCCAPLNAGGFKIRHPGDSLHDLLILTGRIYVGGFLCELHPGAKIPVTFPANTTDRVQVEELKIEGQALAEDQWVVIFNREEQEGILAQINTIDTTNNILTLSNDVSSLHSGTAPRLQRMILYSEQPDYLDSPNWTPVAEQTDLVYLDVWERHITAIEDPDLREVALGGPDTTTRVQTVSQVKIFPNVGDVDCIDEVSSWNNGIAPSGSRLKTQTIPGTEPEDPCLIAEGGGYKGLENRLYRVEIHDGGDIGTATFKWSRDNGSIAYEIERFEANDKVKLKQLGRDKILKIKENDWLEISGNQTDLDTEKAGTIVQVTNVDEAQRILTLNGNVSAHQSESHPKVRRWDTGIDTSTPPTVTAAGPITLEDGVQILFSGNDFKVGDYWIFAARTAIGEIEELDYEPPHGIKHYYCKLALVKWKKDGTAEIKDCRHEFPSLCELPTGDGQCFDFLDELRADGIVRGADGEMGFVVNTIPQNPLEVSYTGGIAYVAGCRYEIPGGTVTVDSSTTHQTLLVNQQGVVELISKGSLPGKYAAIAIISTYQGEILRIIDARFDLTHLDEKVERNFQRTTEARTDRRQFVPLLAYSIKGVEYRDGRDRSFPLGAEPPFSGLPYGLASDGENVWVANFTGDTVAKIPRQAIDANEIEFFPLNLRNGVTWAVAYDGCCLWFTLYSSDQVVRLNPHTGEIRLIPVTQSPLGIAYDGDFVWICNYIGQSISVIDVETCQVVRTIALLDPTGASVRPYNIAFDGSHLWVTADPAGQGSGLLFKIEKPWGDPEQVSNDLFTNSRYLCFDGSHLWISSRNGPLVKVDITTHSQEPVLPNDIVSTHAIAFDGAFLWAFQRESKFSRIYKIDVDTNQLMGQIMHAGSSMAAAFDGTHLWISTSMGVLKKLV